MSLTVAALRSLAALMRVEPSTRQALRSWRDHGPEVFRPALTRLARRLDLGDRIAPAVTELSHVMPEAVTLASVLSVQAEVGGDGAAMVASLARSLEQRTAHTSSGAAASAGALLSGRMVAGLPLAFLPLTPLSAAPLLDPPGVMMLVLGAGLAAAGMRWINRLIPRPPAADDPAAEVAEAAAAVLRGGVNLGCALAATAAHHPDPLLGRTTRRVRLGCPWPAALRRSGEHGYATLGEVIERTDRLGLPPAVALEDFAALRRAERAQEFERAVRRAPVLMVVPLVLCVLPAFALLALGPFLRGLTIAA
ncbi:MAG: type II secretion system F family protein [Actinomycetota bacterium]